MAELIPDDIYEKIFLRMDFRDLIRCKSVCKSWKSFISGSRFVKAHLNHSYHKNENGHRRIGEAVFRMDVGSEKCLLVGSSNGLACVYNDGSELLLGNPSTRDGRTLPKPHTTPNHWSSCWGFGYDSVTDDFKVVKGDTTFDSRKTCFQVFSLKSNVWNIIGEVNYICYMNYCGVLCNGAINWVMRPRNNTKKQVILSFDLSKEEFKEIPEPDVEGYKFCMSLGLMEECLCKFHDEKAWVMKKYNDKQSWEMLPDNIQIKFKFGSSFFEVKHDTFHTRYWFIGNRRFDGGPMIVESLVSPHLQAENE
nr:hypothetical protein [Tanacetum cinerariifolium]